MLTGDIVLVPFPFTDLSGSKFRPALILAKDDVDMIVAFITSQSKWVSESTVPLRATKRNGLKVDSHVRLNKIATLSLDIMCWEVRFNRSN
jgi:mRNA interferase MazF